MSGAPHELHRWRLAYRPGSGRRYTHRMPAVDGVTRASAPSARAGTRASRHYASPAYLELEKKRIFRVGQDRTLTIFEWFFAEPGSEPGWESMQQTSAFSDGSQQEDIVIYEQVQRGLRSRSYDAGRFSAKRENGVYHFENLVREFLGEGQR